MFFAKPAATLLLRHCCHITLYDIDIITPLSLMAASDTPHAIDYASTPHFHYILRLMLASPLLIRILMLLFFITSPIFAFADTASRCHCHRLSITPLFQPQFSLMPVSPYFSRWPVSLPHSDTQYFIIFAITWPINYQHCRIIAAAFTSYWGYTAFLHYTRQPVTCRITTKIRQFSVFTTSPLLIPIRSFHAYYYATQYCRQPMLPLRCHAFFDAYMLSFSHFATHFQTLR